ncbi:TolB family protein [Rubricoccus marinus]|uniref:Dipeptidylpeptidase IV N-terminal domain-containing protein n=1 Tax=Rubricoccus marinus TaxID=716817 RepID=A0A259TV28_9BACT|nr:PD40 domain-containing protein [Rubricoccus marinus]OZC01477.1 hypothetical protein BSZ36_17540 [Rubricoccus marinus]
MGLLLFLAIGCDTTSGPSTAFVEGVPILSTSTPFEFEEGGEVGLRSPLLSPDGKRVALFRVPWSPSPDVSVFDLDGGEIATFSVERGTAGLDWSPNGERIVYAAGFAVFTTRPDGSDRRRVGGGVQPTWSPDGRWITYVRTVCADPPSPPSCGVMIAEDVELEEEGPVNTVPYGGSPAWHPDGLRLFYSAPRPDEGVEAIGVATVRPDGLARKTEILPYRHRFVRDLDISPDGTRIVFAAEDGTWVAASDGSWERLVLPTLVEGGNGVAEAEATLTGGASWTPDGRLIYDLFRASRYAASPITGGASAEGVLTVHLVDSTTDS